VQGLHAELKGEQLRAQRLEAEITERKAAVLSLEKEKGAWLENSMGAHEEHEYPSKICENVAGKIVFAHLSSQAFLSCLNSLAVLSGFISPHLALFVRCFFSFPLLLFNLLFFFAFGFIRHR